MPKTTTNRKTSNQKKKNMISEVTEQNELKNISKIQPLILWTGLPPPSIDVLAILRNPLLYNEPLYQSTEDRKKSESKSEFETFCDAMGWTDVDGVLRKKPIKKETRNSRWLEEDVIEIEHVHGDWGKPNLKKEMAKSQTIAIEKEKAIEKISDKKAAERRRVSLISMEFSVFYLANRCKNDEIFDSWNVIFNANDRELQDSFHFQLNILAIHSLNLSIVSVVINRYCKASDTPNSSDNWNNSLLRDFSTRIELLSYISQRTISMAVDVFGCRQFFEIVFLDLLKVKMVAVNARHWILWCFFSNLIRRFQRILNFQTHYRATSWFSFEFFGFRSNEVKRKAAIGMDCQQLKSPMNLKTIWKLFKCVQL